MPGWNRQAAPTISRHGSSRMARLPAQPTCSQTLVFIPPARLYTVISALHKSNPTFLEMCHLLLCCSPDGRRLNSLPDAPGLALGGFCHPTLGLRPSITAQATSQVVLLPVPQTRPCTCLPQGLRTCEVPFLPGTPSLTFGSYETPPPLWPARVRPFCPLAMCPQKALPSRVYLWNCICLSPRL